MIDINQPEELQEELPFEADLPDMPIEEMIEQDDGSVIIPMDGLEPQEQVFDGNLAEVVPESELTKIAEEFLELIEADKEARKRRDEQYEEGIRRTGLGDDAPGGAKFSGASKVVHPVLAESCIDFAARAIKELFPASGPVRTETTGVLSPPEEMQVKQLALCLNNQFTKKIKEYRNVLEQELTQLPLGGSQFKKFYPNVEKKRVVAEFVPVDDIFIPFYADSFYEAERVTHRQFVSQAKLEERVGSGQYRDIASIKIAMDPERSASAVANDKVEGKSASGMNEDGTRTVYEVYTELEIAEDTFSEGSKVPYIITIDEYDQSIFSIRRNWDQNDPNREKLDWIIEDIFIPWRGAYGIGLPHLIGGLAGSATGALRALLDSAHINNAPTLLKLKNSRISGQTQQIAVTQIAEIEGPTGMDDIRKYLMPMPFNAPSPVLLQLLGWLTDAAKGVVSTASEKIADATSNTPVGTTQALIEQGAIIFSSIHSRLHFSQARGFEVVLRILKTYFPEQLQEYGLDPATASMKGVYPVSDPNIFSEAQRISQMQGALQLAKEAPQLYNLPELHKSMLSLMKINNAERFLIPPPAQPQPMDPAAEFVAFLTGQPVAVVPQQDHRSHIMIHVSYLQNPMLGLNPVMVPVTAKVLDHLREHLGHYFSMRLQQAVQQAQQKVQQAQQQIQQQMMQQGQVLQARANQAVAMGAPQEQVMMEMKQIATGMQQQAMASAPQLPPPEQIMAQATQQILQEDAEFAQMAMEVINAADEFVKNRMQAGDPNILAIQEQAKLNQMEMERKTKKDEKDGDLAERREDNLRELDAVKRMEEKRQNDFDMQMQERELAHLQKMDSLEQKIELLKNDQDNKQTQMTELLKNHDDNITTVIVEQIRAMLSPTPKETLKTSDEYVADVKPHMTGGSPAI
jgi:hypothetical protein